MSPFITLSVAAAVASGGRKEYSAARQRLAYIEGAGQLMTICVF